VTIASALRRRAHVSAPANWREVAPVAALCALALALRLVRLGHMPLHHDESEHAWFAWLLRTGRGYHYDPVFHGPVQFYSIAVTDLIAGTRDVAARIAPALLGTGVTLLPLALRRQLGRTGSLAAAGLLCLSPSYLYFSRFAREDIYFACVSLALLVVILRFISAPRAWQPPLLGGLLAVSFATKETTFISAFLLGLYLVAALLVQILRCRAAGGQGRDAALATAARSLGAAPWLTGAATFLVVYTLLFTTFLTNPGGLQEGLTGGIRYWLSQQPVGRGGQPWFYYLVLLPAYEWPILAAGIVGIAHALRRPSTGGLLLVWFFAGNLAVYSWASERMPWLILHPLLPLALLAGSGIQVIVRQRHALPRRAALGAVVLLAAAAAFAGGRLAFAHPADPAELLVQVQTSSDVPGIRDEIVALERRVRAATGRSPTLEVDSWGGTGWPWAWYLRDLPAGYYDFSTPSLVPRAQIALVAAPNLEAVQGRFTGYVARRFRLRVWWVPTWHTSAGDWGRWLVWRTPWSHTAEMDETLYVRRDVARLLRSP
jgi:uncharacterized protein (TIGR03663 family)